MKEILVDICRDHIPLEKRVYGTREAGVRPVFCQPIQCKRVLIEGVTFRNSPSWTIQPVWCEELTIRKITVFNPPSPFSHNTDGIDPDGCRNVLIEHCTVDTGDDAICIKAGRDWDAWQTNIPCENIVIRHCKIFSGHGGITIGSEMSAGVSNVHAYDCELDGTDTPIRLKSKPGRGGYIKNVLIENIKIKRALHEAISVSLYYDGNKEETLDLSALKDVPEIKDITIRNVECAKAKDSIHLRGIAGYPLKNIVLENISIQALHSPLINDVENLQQQDVQVSLLSPGDEIDMAAPIPEAVQAARVIATSIHAPEVEFPPEKRTMAKRNAIPITHRELAPPTRLSFTTRQSPSSSMTLRLTCAVDERVLHKIDVHNAVSDEFYGTMEILYASPGQVFELELTQEQAASALKDGLSLSNKEKSAFWAIAPGMNAPPAVLPQLYADHEKPTLENFLSLFCSPASLQPFDWMEVCVLDGLLDWAHLGRKDAVQQVEHHLKTFIHPETGQRETIKGHPCDNEPGGPESTGPFAILALCDPLHPALRFADEGYNQHYNPSFDAIGSSQIVTESNYNIAYPLMSMGIFQNRPELIAKSIHQLEQTCRYLTEEDNLYLRNNPETGERTFKNWSRGVAWYMIGLLRSLALLPPHQRPAHLVAEANRTAAWVTKHQLENGLWPCFLKENDILPDSSGSAGIAAAIALGINKGIIDKQYLSTAERAYEGLLTYMTHDGWLRGTSQSNKRETHYMDIQRAPFRVIAPWGMGLFAQLAAQLNFLKQ